MGWVALVNLVLYVALAAYTAVTIPLFFLFMLLCRPFCTQRRAMRLFRMCICLYGRGVIYGVVRPFIRVHYRDFAEDDEREPFVYVCNHRSSSDPFLMSLMGTEAVQVVNKWPFHLPVWGPFARWAGYISVRAMSFEDFKTTCMDYLDQGVSIAAFPEGTRSASRRMGQFHGALFRVCLEAGATIVPICIMGNEDKPRKGSLLVRPGEVHVDRLPGLRFDAYNNMTPFALKNHVRGLIEEHILKTEGTENGPVA